MFIERIQNHNPNTLDLLNDVIYIFDITVLQTIIITNISALYILVNYSTFYLNLCCVFKFHYFNSHFSFSGVM